MKHRKIKTGTLYEIYDNSLQIEINYGTCIYLGESKEKLWMRSDIKIKGNIYRDFIVLNFYSLLRNEKFKILQKDFFYAGSGYLIKKLTI